MKKPNIPDQISLTLKEQGYHTRQKRNGDILFWNNPSHKMSVSFLNEERTSFAICFKIGELSNDYQYAVGLSCCVNVNPTLLIAKLLVEEDNDTQYLCAKTNYTCFTDSEANKFIKIALGLLYFAVETACEYMNKNVATKSPE